jgi:3-phenylpropionate/cinnamic acid dioxygenase small subunit
MSALLRVAELNAAYAATIDADRLEAWPDFFVEDCLYKITHRRGYGAGIIYADSRAMLRDRAAPHTRGKSPAIRLARARPATSAVLCL